MSIGEGDLLLTFLPRGHKHPVRQGPDSHAIERLNDDLVSRERLEARQPRAELAKVRPALRRQHGHFGEVKRRGGAMPLVPVADVVAQDDAVPGPLGRGRPGDVDLARADRVGGGVHGRARRRLFFRGRGDLEAVLALAHLVLGGDLEAIFRPGLQVFYSYAFEMSLNLCVVLVCVIPRF